MNEFAKYFEENDMLSKKINKKDQIIKGNNDSKKLEKMSRELSSLLSSNSSDIVSLMPTSFSHKLYNKNNLKSKPSRKWQLIEFTNQARNDDLKLRHWVRIPDIYQNYPFAKFRKHACKVEINEDDYNFYLKDSYPGWSYENTKILLELCSQFDNRFHVVHDRFISYDNKSVDELKDYYYWIVKTLIETNNERFSELKLPLPFDLNNEIKRKKQLELFYSRTPEQIEEQMNIYNEMKRIEQKKLERSKNNSGIGGLIYSAMESNTLNGSIDSIENDASPFNENSPTYSIDSSSYKFSHKSVNRKQKNYNSSNKNNMNITPISKKVSSNKVFDIKTTGTHLRSIKTKVPINIGNKKAKFIEQTLAELSLEIFPMPNQKICELFNQLRTHILLAYDLQQANHSSECEFQTLRHQYLSLHNKEPNFDEISTEEKPLMEET